jgi:hypothetical protein
MTEQTKSERVAGTPRLFDEHAQYRALRETGSLRHQMYRIEVEEWKIPHLVRALPPGVRYSSVGEIACATGELIAGFPAPPGVRKWGCDISGENIRTARWRFPGITFFEGDFREAALQADLVIVSDVLDLVPDDTGFLRDAGRLGPCVLVLQSLERPAWVSRGRTFGVEHPAMRLRAYDEQTMLGLFHRAGYDVLTRHTAWFVEQPCYREHVRLRWGQGPRSWGMTARHLAHDLLLRSRSLRRRYFPAALFAFLQTKEVFP